MNVRRVGATAIMVVGTVLLPPDGSPFARATFASCRSPDHAGAEAVSDADRIAAETNARYGRVRPRLTVTEAASTGVVESFTLMTRDGVRVVPAADGLYFAICPGRARCPHPVRRYARRPAAFVPRREALELALRAFRETSAGVVAVSLPTTRFRLFIVEREELVRGGELGPFGDVLAGEPALPPAPVRRDVDRVTRPRIFVPLGLEPTATGGDTFVATR